MHISVEYSNHVHVRSARVHVTHDMHEYTLIRVKIMHLVKICLQELYGLRTTVLKSAVVFIMQNLNA